MSHPNYLRLAKRLNVSIWLLAITLFAVHLFVVLGYSINLPFWDDWDALRPGHLDRALSWKWLVAFHNTHRNVFTHLSIWILYRLNGWNLNAHIAANFVLYTLLSAATIRYLERVFSTNLAVWLLFPASAIADEVHNHAFNNCWTFYVLFFFLSLALVFRRDRLSWFAVVASVASTYAAGSGWLCSLAFVFLSLALALLRRDHWKSHLLQAAATSAFLALWFIGYPSQSEPLVMPWTQLFWRHFGNLLALGLGYHRISELPGLLFFAGVITLAVFAGRQAIRSKEIDRIEKWLLLTTALGGIFLASGAISIARGWAEAHGAKSGRYALAVLFCPPLAWIMLRQYLNGRLTSETGKAVIWVAAGALLLAPLVTEFEYRKVYRPAGERRLDGVRCVREGLLRGKPAYCESINPYGADSAAIFEARARELRLSYLSEQSPAPLP